MARNKRHGHRIVEKEKKPKARKRDRRHTHLRDGQTYISNRERERKKESPKLEIANEEKTANAFKNQEMRSYLGPYQGSDSSGKENEEA